MDGLVCVGVGVGVVAVCVVVVLLAQGLRSPSSSPTLAIFPSSISICLSSAPPVHPAVIGDLAFAGM